MTSHFEIVRNLAEQILRESGAKQVSFARGAATRLLEDLGFDSLMRVELARRLEQLTRLQFDQTKLFESETLGDIEAALGLNDPSSALQRADWDDDDFTTFLPSRALTIPQVLLQHVENHQARVHVRLQSADKLFDPITYGEIYDRARRIAQSLCAVGIEAGDRVALLLPTGRDFLESFLGILECGAVAVPLYPAAHPSQISEHIKRQAILLTNCQAKLVMTDDRIVVLAAAMRIRIEILTLSKLLSLGRVEFVASSNPQALAMLQYTSGSTAQPKGVMLSHANLLANIRAFGQALNVTSSDRCVSWLPLYHDMGLIGAWLGSLYFGVKLHLMSPLDFLARPVRWLRAISETRATISAAPNFAYHLCARSISQAACSGLDLSSWRAALNGAEPVTANVLNNFVDRFAPIGFRSDALLPVYGMAENSLALTIPAPGSGVTRVRVAIAAGMVNDDINGSEFVGCGSVLSEHEIRIINNDGGVVGQNHEGEIQFRGPSATAGYYNNPQATAALFDSDWLRSGDRGFVRDGALFVTGRIKDIIIRAGRNIYPHLIEQIVSGVAGVRQDGVAAFAVSDPASASERLVLVAETRIKEQSRRQELEASIRAAVLAQDGATLDQIILTRPGSVLKTSSGKVRRSAMRQLYESGASFGRKSVVQSRAAISFNLLTAKALAYSGQSAQILYSAWVYTVVGFLILASVPFLVCLPRISQRRYLIKIFVHIAAALSAVRIRCSGKLTKQSVIYCINHSSYCDAVFLSGLLPTNTDFVAMSELKHAPLIGWYLRSLGAHFIARSGAATLEDTKSLQRALEDGRSLAIFPEGTFVRRSGLLPFKLGAFELAANSGRNVVPLVLQGTRVFLRPDQWLLSRSEIKLNVLEAISAPGKTWQQVCEFRDLVWNTMREHY